MNKKTKTILIIIGLLVVIAAASAYYKIMIQKDYVTEEQIDCDPTTEKCFIWSCDPRATEEADKCTGDAEMDVWYYKLAERNAANVMLCDSSENEDCDPWECLPGEKDCSVTLCDETTKLAQGAECSDPVKYNEANSEEEVVCAEDDTECADTDAAVK